MTLSSCLTSKSTSNLNFELDKTYISKKICPSQKQTSSGKEMNVENIFRKNPSSLRKLSQYFSRIIESSHEKFKILSSSARTSSSFWRKKRKEKKLFSFQKSSSFEILSSKRESSKFIDEGFSTILSFPFILSFIQIWSLLAHLILVPNLIERLRSWHQIINLI